MSADQVTLDVAGGMPRVAAELPHSPALNRCQHCGFIPEWTGDLRRGAIALDKKIDGTTVVVLERWQEHDEKDRPEGLVVILCHRCSEKIIEPHARLYRQLYPMEPFPGAHGICVGCVNRMTGVGGGLGCTVAKMNGGQGLSLRGPKQIRAHLCFRGKNRNQSGWRTLWSGHVEQCSRRDGGS